MCGIAGIVSLDSQRAGPTQEQLAAMAGALRHRGPDEFGTYRDDRAGLAHARLSIIDLAAGQQPMANEDETCGSSSTARSSTTSSCATELEALGHRFRTRSDTEVIVHACEEWGADAFRRFNGQWAIALWDRPTRTAGAGARSVRRAAALHLPSTTAGCSSPARSRRSSPPIRRFRARFDPIGLDADLHVLDAGAAADGVPGRDRARARRTCASTRRDASPTRAPGIRRIPTDATAGFTRLARRCRRRGARGARARRRSLRMLRADVPVGSYLSGGLDSSLVAALGLRAKGDSSTPSRCASRTPSTTRREFQRLMAERLGSEHHEVVVSRGDIARVFPDVIAHTERPILRTAPAPLFLLSKLVHDAGIKVVLTGEGADEMFAGYDLFREAKVRRFWARAAAVDVAAAPARAALSVSGALAGVAAGAVAAVLRPGSRRGGAARLRPRPALALDRRAAAPVRPGAARRARRAATCAPSCLGTLPAAFARWTPLAQDQYLEIRTLLSGYLLSAQGDRMLMAHSVEGRFPFLDRQVAALADSLPPSYKLRVLDEKHVLKRVAARRRAGRDPRSGKKQPYRAPDALSFAGPEARSGSTRWPAPRALAEAGVFDAGGGSPGDRQVPRPRGIGPVLQHRQHGGRRHAVDAARLRPVDPTRSRGRARRQAAHRHRPDRCAERSAAMKETPFFFDSDGVSLFALLHQPATPIEGRTPPSSSAIRLARRSCGPIARGCRSRGS